MPGEGGPMAALDAKPDHPSRQISRGLRLCGQKKALWHFDELTRGGDVTLHCEPDLK